MTALWMFLYGENDPEVSALMADETFRDLVRALFEGGEAAVPQPPPPLWDRALALELLTTEGGRYRPGARLVTIPASAEQDLPRRMASAFDRYGAVARETVAALREAYRHTTPRHHFPWAAVQHAVVAGLFLDQAMGSELIRSGGIARKPLGGCVVWAFEGLSADNSFGIQGRMWMERRTFFGQLWHRRVPRDPLRLGLPQLRQLVRYAYDGDGETDSVDPRILLHLRYLKLIRRSGDRTEVLVPVFHPRDAERFLPHLLSGARGLVSEGIEPALDVLHEHPWWRRRIEDERYRHAAVRLTLEYGMDRAVKDGLVDPFPESAPDPAWGRWLWAEPEGEGGQAGLLDVLQEEASR